MARGAKPKIYDAELVERVRRLYDDGLTQAEVAREVGLSQKVVWNLMRRHGIRSRAQAKRDQCGPANANWKGDGAAYSTFHRRVEDARGRPQACDQCGTTEATVYEWANLTGRYDDPSDYRRMCRSCHRKYDNARRGGGA
jgi:hypothetical protein